MAEEKRTWWNDTPGSQSFRLGLAQVTSVFSFAKASHKATPDLDKLGICNPSIGTDMKCLNNTIDHCCI